MTELNNIFPQKAEVPQEYNLNFPFVQSEYLVYGEIKKWTGNFQNVYSPIYVNDNGNFNNLIGEYPLLSEKESLNALEAAMKAYDNGNGEWAQMTIEQRIDCMKTFVHIMKEQRNIIVKLLMWEIGKTLGDSEKEFDRTIEYINNTIEALKDLDRSSSRFVISQGIIAQIRRSPLGVVLCMGPFNYPLNETFTTLIPALIMGNTIIFKPPKHGVLLHQPLLKAFQQAFPKGVVNTVYGSGEVVITPLMKSGKINVLAFIGSSKVANILQQQHPKPNRLKCVLGLEAKNPAIILEDANIDDAVKECVLGALSYNGQRCTAIKIIFVHKCIADEFIEKFSNSVENLKIGLPWEKDTNITPLPEEKKPEYLCNLIEDAKSKGAKIVNKSGGERYKSLFFPTILHNVTREMKIYHEEQFGPVVPIVSYSDINEPLQNVIESDYGQQAAIFGKNSSEIAKLVDTLTNQVCRVNINSQCQRGPDDFPFTGRKDSAEATLSISDALRVFSIRTLVAAKQNEENQHIITEIIKDNKSKFLNTDFIF